MNAMILLFPYTLFFSFPKEEKGIIATMGVISMGSIKLL